MLTSFMDSAAAFVTAGGELLCHECFGGGNAFARPVTRYELNEEQDYAGEDYEWPSLTHEGYPDDDAERDRVAEYHAECQRALDDVNGHVLREEYHYHRGG